MSSTDPYAPPVADLGGQPATAGGGAGPSQRALQFLRETKPWVRLFAVLLFIGAGFMVMGGIGMMLISVVGAFISGEGESGVAEMAIGGVGGLLYIVLAGIYIPPALYLWRYANAIQVALDQGGSVPLEEALRHQKSFWKFVGIAALIMMVAAPILGIIFAVVAAVAGVAAAG